MNFRFTTLHGFKLLLAFEPCLPVKFNFFLNFRKKDVRKIFNQSFLEVLRNLTGLFLFSAKSDIKCKNLAQHFLQIYESCRKMSKIYHYKAIAARENLVRESIQNIVLYFVNLIEKSTWNGVRRKKVEQLVLINRKSRSVEYINFESLTCSRLNFIFIADRIS